MANIFKKAAKKIRKFVKKTPAGKLALIGAASVALPVVAAVSISKAAKAVKQDRKIKRAQAATIRKQNAQIAAQNAAMATQQASVAAQSGDASLALAYQQQANQYSYEYQVNNGVAQQLEQQEPAIAAKDAYEVECVEQEAASVAANELAQTQEPPTDFAESQFGVEEVPVGEEYYSDEGGMYGLGATPTVAPAKAPVDYTQTIANVVSSQSEAASDEQNAQSLANSLGQSIGVVPPQNLNDPAAAKAWMDSPAVSAAASAVPGGGAILAGAKIIASVQGGGDVKSNTGKFIVATWGALRDRDTEPARVAMGKAIIVFKKSLAGALSFYQYMKRRGDRESFGVFKFGANEKNRLVQISAGVIDALERISGHDIAGKINVRTFLNGSGAEKFYKTSSRTKQVSDAVVKMLQAGVVSATTDPIPASQMQEAKKKVAATETTAKAPIVAKSSSTPILATGAILALLLLR